MKNHEFQELVDRTLSGLVWDERKRQKVLHAISEEEKPMKKFSASFILAAVVLCLSVTALAGGLMLSGKVDDMALASRELEKAYGVTPTMQGSYFGKTVEQGDGETVVTFWGIENLRYVLGEYTVTVGNGKAAVKWSHDGEDTSGGFEAEAWGVDQMNAMLDWEKEHHNVTGYYPQAKAIAQKHSAESRSGVPSEEEIAAATQQRKEEERQARSAAKLTEQEMIDLARQALVSVYGLTDEQMRLIECPQDIEDYFYFNMQDGKPVYSVWFYLLQAPVPDDPGVFPEFTEKDGIYVVSVNVETGVIESLIYDTSLGGNG